MMTQTSTRIGASSSQEASPLHMLIQLIIVQKGPFGYTGFPDKITKQSATTFIQLSKKLHRVVLGPRNRQDLLAL